MGFIKHDVRYRESSDFDIKTLSFKNRIKFEEDNYDYKVTSGTDDWYLQVGHVLKRIVDQINLNIMPEQNGAILRIYNLNVVDFRMAPLTFLNNTLQIKLFYELSDINNKILKNGSVFEIIKFNAIKHGTFTKSAEIALFTCINACLISLLREVDRI